MKSSMNINRLVEKHTCKHIVSQTAADPQLPSSPSSTNLGMRSLKYMFQTLIFILIESAMGWSTWQLFIKKRFKSEAEPRKKYDQKIW